MQSISRVLSAEFLGTFLLVLLGPGAAIVDAEMGGLGALGVGLVFGAVVWAMIRLFGLRSGAHINPAVSLALAWSGHLPYRLLVPYITVQCAGALAASFVHMWIWPEVTNYGMTTFDATKGWSFGFGLELGLTALLLGSIYFAIHTPSRQKWVATIVGTTVGLEAWLAGPLCGASMNPARSLGPAIASNEVGQLWVYLTATSLGALLVAFFYRNRFGSKSGV